MENYNKCYTNKSVTQLSYNIADKYIYAREDMKCDKCGSEIPENSKFCLECGTKIVLQEDSLNNEVNDTDNNICDKEDRGFDKRKNGYIIWFVFLIVSAILLVLGNEAIEKYQIAKEKNELYNELLSCEEEKQYDRANEIIGLLGDYKDVKLVQERITKGIYDKIYADALEEYKDIDNMTLNRFISLEEKINSLPPEYDVEDMRVNINRHGAQLGFVINDPDLAIGYYERIDRTDDEQVKYEKCIALKNMMGEWKNSSYGNITILSIDNQRMYLKAYKEVQKGKYDNKYDRKSNYYKISDISEEGELEVEIAFENGIVSLIDERHIQITYSDGTFMSFYRTTDANDIDSNLIKENPTIGMNKSEVKATKWGSPEEINKTTYEWGTTEQWVYPNYKYVYFENGIVTAISE